MWGRDEIMLNHTKRDKLAAEVTVTYSPRFPKYGTRLRQSVKVTVHGCKGMVHHIIDNVTKAEAYEAAKNLRLMYIMQHNLG